MKRKVPAVVFASRKNKLSKGKSPELLSQGGLLGRKVLLLSAESSVQSLSKERNGMETTM